MQGMATLEYHVRTEMDPDCRYRIRWVVWDPFAGIFKSPKNFATEKEALYSAERFIDRRQLVWQRKMTKTPSRPRDLNQWAKRMVEIATGDADDPEPKKQTGTASPQSLGGRARAQALKPKRRTEIAKSGAAKRWKKPHESSDA
jgi:hypothetical protein